LRVRAQDSQIGLESLMSDMVKSGTLSTRLLAPRPPLD
jgi:hypothetical protein